LNEREDAKANASGGKANARRQQGERVSVARRTRSGGKANAQRQQGERAPASARRTRIGGESAIGGGRGEDGAITVYLSAPSTSKSSAVNA
jgi:hypothetical protein